MRKLLLVVSLIVCRSAMAQSQNAPIAATWDSVFLATFDAYDRRDWPTLARDADPRALVELKDRELATGRQAVAAMKSQRVVDPRDFQRAIEYFERKTADIERASPETLFVHEVSDRFRGDSYRRPTVVRSIIGRAVDGDSLVHIVFRYRASWPARPPIEQRERTVVDVLTLRRTGDRWRETLNGGLTQPLWDGMDMINAVQ